MKILITSLKITPNYLLGFVILSIITLTTKIVFLNTIPAHSEWAYRLGLTAESLLSANLAAFLFYLFSFKVPLVIERQELCEDLAFLMGKAANGVWAYLQMAASKIDQKELKREDVTLAAVEGYFARIDPNGEAPLGNISQAFTWLQAMSVQQKEAERYISQIRKHGRYLESELVSILNDIEYSQHATVSKLMPSNVRNTDMTVWASSYYKVYDAARRLDDYNHRFRNLYSYCT